MAKNATTDKNLTLMSGLYTRVARQVGVHPSYVSRVARGERRSESISHAIAAELAQFLEPNSHHHRTRRQSAEGANELRRGVIQKLKANPKLSKMSVMVIDQEHWTRSGPVARITRSDLQERIAENAVMIAASVEQFQRLSRRLEDFDHVLSLTDGDGIVLYSFGTTGMIRQQGRVPGANWARDYMGPSEAARAIAAGVPLAIIGPPGGEDALLTVRMACPIRLGDRRVAGVVVLTVDLGHAKAEQLIDITKIAKKICGLVERERIQGKMRQMSPVQPFEEAELHLARVMSMPQIDQTTRTHLATVLAELEGKRREVLLTGEQYPKKRRGNAKAQVV